MKTIESVMAALHVGREEAETVLKTATEYSNRGKGLIANNPSTTEAVAELFAERRLWLSADLNDRVGWQFSQAIFHLRRAGWNIKTVCLGEKQYAYKLLEKGAGL